MENCIVSENNNDFLSQSYSQSIERITGTKDSTFNFQIPKKLLEVRKKTWDRLFDKYSKEMTNDIELNVDTLEPEEEEEEEKKEEEKAVSEEECSCGQRVPMRKPATLVQYWINTGNPPYKAFLAENEFSETGSSISEKEITSPSVSPVFTNAVNAINACDKQKCKNDSSCSSVDTAAYILSNANITKKVDTTAIKEGTKYVEVKSLKEIAVEDIQLPPNDKNQHVEPTRIGCTVICNDNDNVDDVDVVGTELYPMPIEYTASEVRDSAAADSLVTPARTIQSNMCSQSSSCEKTDEYGTSQRNFDVQTIGDIFRRFDKTSKRLIRNDRNDDVSDSERDKVAEMEFHEKEMSENKIIAKDASLTAFHRKKLYTGRDSPVDLILTETHGISRLTGAGQRLHPALDPDSAIKRESFLNYRSKNKHSPSAKRSFDSKKIKTKGTTREFDCISSEIITGTNNNKCMTDDKIQDSTADSSFKSLSDFHDNSNRERQDDIPFQERNDTNISVKSEKVSKQNLTSLNRKPIILLEGIKPSFNRCKFDKNTHITEEKNVCNNSHLNKLKKLHCHKIENLESETIDNDARTILIASHRSSSSLSDCLDSRLNVEDEFSAPNVESKDRKLSSLKDNDMSQGEELRAEELLQSSKEENCVNAATESQVSNENNNVWQNVLSDKSKTYSYLYGGNEMENVKLREIKVVLERLPSSVRNYTSTMTKKTLVLNENNAMRHQEISKKSKTSHLSNPYGTNMKDNTKLREIRVVLERLPVNVCSSKEGSNNVTNTNTFRNKRKVLPNTGLQDNHKREPQIRKMSKILACENGPAVRPVRNVRYSSKRNTKSEKNNDKINDTIDIVVKHGSQIFDQTMEPYSTLQRKVLGHKNRSRTSQDDRSKYSVLTFSSSDEDNFVRSIQRSRKRSKLSIDDNVLGEPNIVEKDSCDQTILIISEKDKYRYSRDLNTVIYPPEKTKIVERDVGLIKEKKEHSKVVINSFGSKQMSATSVQTSRNKGFMFFSSEDERDNDSVADILDKAKEKILLFDSKKTTCNNSKRHSNGVTKKDVINRKKNDNVHVIFFQTRTFDTNSSDSEESNNYTSFTCKALKRSHNRLRRHNCDNSEETFSNSIAKRYSKRHSTSLNSSREKYDRIHDRTRSKSVDKKVRKNKLEVSNLGDIKSRINDTRKDASVFSLMNDLRDTSVQEKILSNTLETFDEINLDSLPKNKEISNKSKNSVVSQQSEVTESTVRKLLIFQTKSYYNSSDSDETL